MTVSRNSQSRFAMNPVGINMQRSRFLMEPEIKTSWNMSELFPIGKPIEILPGDTFDVSVSAAIRSQPLVCSPMDNIKFDCFFFFIPNRLVWNHWKEFMGENANGHWTPTIEYTIPNIPIKEGVPKHSIGDYFGLPTKGTSVWQTVPRVSHLPFRAYCLVWNEWFRSEALQNPVNIHLDDSNVPEVLVKYGSYDYHTSEGTYDPIVQSENNGALLKVCKTHDYFTSALPGPLRGPDVTMVSELPVYFAEEEVDPAWVIAGYHTPKQARIDYMSGSPGQPIHNPGTLTWKVNGVETTAAAQPLNWYVDANFTVSQLRTALAIQKLYEKDARAGGRYVSQLKAHFGVTASDASLQRSQYLGGFTKDVVINQILQTSETAETPQGNVAGYSLTGVSKDGHWIHSFDEHGILLCLGCTRLVEHSYQQGISKDWLRQTRTDFYYPVMANLSEMPLYNKNIYAGTNQDDEVFGYQEAWAEYRYTPSQITASMRSDANGSLDSWHFGDYYNSLPSLSSSWIEEDKNLFDRALAVSSEVSDQFFGDFKLHIKATRPMPIYSIPGITSSI